MTFTVRCDVLNGYSATAENYNSDNDDDKLTRLIFSTNITNRQQDAFVSVRQETIGLKQLKFKLDIVSCK